jgi:hypothetical protein
MRWGRHDDDDHGHPAGRGRDVNRDRYHDNRDEYDDDDHG